MLQACPGPNERSQGPSVGTDTTADASAADARSQQDAGTDLTPVAQLATVLCQRQSECCLGNAGASCLQARTNSLRLRLNGPRITIDAVALEACLQKIAGISCTTVAAYGGVVHVFDVCDPFIRPTATEGEACGGLFGDDQCETAFCQNGTCQTPVPGQQGERCKSPDRPCAAGLGCGPIGECAPSASEGNDCSLHGVCDAPLLCVAAPGGAAHQCQRPRMIMIGEQCEQGTVCNFPCACPVGQTGCATGLCGDTSRCMP